MNEFETLELAPELCQALEDLKHHSPTDIQQRVIKAALDGRDVLASSPTGTGKTAAFLLPVLQYLLDFPRRKGGPPRVLILTPTRELAQQVHHYAEKLTTFTPLASAVIVGGVLYQKDDATLQQPHDILVATPGRLLEYIGQGALHTESIEWVILDEADRMLDMGFHDAVLEVLKACPYRKHSMLFSATIDEPRVHLFSEAVLKDPIRIDADPSRKERKKITQWYHRADHLEHKRQLLLHCLRQPEHKIIVFIKTKERLHELSAWLDQQGVATQYLEGDLPQHKRTQIINRFRLAKDGILLATDVASRGIDIQQVTWVINYDLPYTSDVYLHRIGRTARAGNKGQACSLVEAHDFPMMGRIQRYLEEPIKERFIDGLRPQHKKPVFRKAKKNKTKTTSSKATEKVTVKSSVKGTNKKEGIPRDKPKNLDSIKQ